MNLYKKDQFVLGGGYLGFMAGVRFMSIFRGEVLFGFLDS